jgi:hypothetical protein
VLGFLGAIFAICVPPQAGATTPRMPERLGRGDSFARFPITFTSTDVPWDKWGDYVIFGLGTNRRNRHEMNLHLYRRVRCPDGSAWYSRADVTDANRALVFYIRLPVCGYKVPPRKLTSG